MALQDGVNITDLGMIVVGTLPAGVNVTDLGVCVVGVSTNVTPPVWTDFTFANAVIGTPYSQDWDLFPAFAPTSYTLQSGALPTGLSLSSPGGDVGRLSGTPTALGTFTFTIRASNAYGYADKTFSMDVTLPGAGMIVNPGMTGGMRG